LEQVSLGLRTDQAGAPSVAPFLFRRRFPQGKVILLVAAVSSAAAATWGVYRSQVEAKLVPATVMPKPAPSGRAPAARSTGSRSPAIVDPMVAEELASEALPAEPAALLAPKVARPAQRERSAGAGAPAPGESAPVRGPIVRLSLTPPAPSSASSKPSSAAPPALPLRVPARTVGPNGTLAPELPDRSLLVPESGAQPSGQGPGPRGGAENAQG
jgi:hypothetical protein